MTGEDQIRAASTPSRSTARGSWGSTATGSTPGCRADAVLLDAYGVSEALRTHPARLAVVRGGSVVAQTAPVQRTVVAPALAGPVEFRQPAFS